MYDLLILIQQIRVKRLGGRRLHIREQLKKHRNDLLLHLALHWQGTKLVLTNLKVNQRRVRCTTLIRVAACLFVGCRKSISAHLCRFISISEVIYHLRKLAWLLMHLLLNCISLSSQRSSQMLRLIGLAGEMLQLIDLFLNHLGLNQRGNGGVLRCLEELISVHRRSLLMYFFLNV